VTSGFAPIAGVRCLWNHRPMATRARRPALHRSGSDRVIGGVAGGIAERLEIDPIVVRLAFVVVAFAGGFGVVAYLVSWLVSTDAPAPAPDGARTTGTRQVLAVALVVAGILVLCKTAGLWFGDAVVWSVGLAAFGSAILWTRSDDASRARFARLASRLPRTPADVLTGRSRTRIALGAALVVAGMATFLIANTSLSALRNVAFAVMVTALGVGLVLGPWIYELFRQLGAERRERIRSEERAEVAAHLHDSVLQTLAMIQRAPTPQQMASLARGQERELRQWLYGRTSGNGAETLATALEATAGRVETMYGVRVETVVVGDASLDDRLRALVDAAGEAVSNAARHSGASTVSVYAEVAAESIGLYVRDEGSGFDPDVVPDERRGLAESIVGRMERNGGTATITSKKKEGTEVYLSMPRRPS
jgi:signal transduction histidine kinase/phage shock protein PspC (stress-responsive transcriptional regulator)